MNFDTERFIMEIQLRPSLWDSKSADYLNRDLKKKCWEEIAEIFGEKGLSPVEKKVIGIELQKRWKGIRSSYSRELRRQSSLKTGYSATRKSEYTYFKQLQFLQKEEEGTSGNLNETEEDCSDHTAAANSKTELPSKRIKIEAVTCEADPFVASLNQSIQTRCDEDEDEDRYFLLSLLSTLREVPRNRKMATKIRLMTVLQEAVEDSSAPLPGHCKNCRVPFRKLNKKPMQDIAAHESPSSTSKQRYVSGISSPENVNSDKSQNVHLL